MSPETLLDSGWTVALWAFSVGLLVWFAGSVFVGLIEWARRILGF